MSVNDNNMQINAKLNGYGRKSVERIATFNAKCFGIKNERDQFENGFYRSQ